MDQRLDRRVKRLKRLLESEILISGNVSTSSDSSSMTHHETGISFSGVLYYGQSRSMLTFLSVRVCR